MAEGNSENPNKAIIPILDIGTSSILSFIKDSKYGVGIYILYTQNASDSPLPGGVSFTILLKPLANGEYSTGIMIAQRVLYVTGLVRLSQDVIAWTKIESTAI